MSRHRFGPLCFCLGLAGSFSLVGLATAAGAQALGIDRETLRTTSALLMLAAGVVLLIPAAQHALSHALSPLASLGGRLGGVTVPGGGSLLGHILAGAGLGAIWSPCAGPTLGAAIALSSQAETLLMGWVLMLVFGLGAAAPLLILAYLSRAALAKLLVRFRDTSRSAQLIFGGVLILVPIATLSGVDKALEARVLKVLPSGWVDLTTRF